MEDKQEEISAFAFNTAKALESFIDVNTNNLRLTNKMLEANILNFYQKLREVVQLDSSWDFVLKEYETRFNIQTVTEGKIGDN